MKGKVRLRTVQFVKHNHKFIKSVAGLKKSAIALLARQVTFHSYLADGRGSRQVIYQLNKKNVN